MLSVDAVDCEGVRQLPHEKPTFMLRVGIHYMFEHSKLRFGMVEGHILSTTCDLDGNVSLTLSPPAVRRISKNSTHLSV